MKFNASKWIAAIVAIPISIATFLLSVITFDFQMIIDMFIGSVSFLGVFFPTHQLYLNKQLEKYSLTKSEYKYVYNELKKAEKKLYQLKQNYKRVRSFRDFKMVHEIYKLTRIAYKTVYDSPNLFFKSQQFFHSTLDSAVMTIENYMYLNRLPGKTREDKIEIHSTKIALNELKRTLKANIKEMHQDRFDALKVEREIISRNLKKHEQKYSYNKKHTNNNANDTHEFKEPRALENKLERDKVNLKKKVEPNKESVIRGERNER